MVVAAKRRTSLLSLELMSEKFRALGARCPEPLYAFATAIDTPSPVAPHFSDGMWQAIEGVTEPHSPMGSPGLGLVRSGYSMTLSRDGFDLIATKDDVSRLYTVGVLGRRSPRVVDTLKKTLFLAEQQGNSEAVHRVRYELTHAHPLPASTAWLDEYEVLAGRAWDCVPADLKSMQSHLYMYPLAMAKPAWAWTAIEFVLAWTADEPNGLVAPRTLVSTDGDCEVEGSLRAIEAAAPNAARTSRAVGTVVTEQRRLLSTRWSPLWPCFDDSFSHPLPRCRAVMEPTLCDAAVLAIEQIVSRHSMQPAKPKRTSKRRVGAVPGWTLKALAAYAGIKRSLFLDICEEVGIKRAKSGGHGYEFTLEELRAMVARCKTISGKRLWAHTGTKWQELIDDHVRRSTGA